MSNIGLWAISDILKQGCQQGMNPGLLEIPDGETESYAFKAFKVFYHHACLTYDFPKLVTEASLVTSNDYEISLSTLTRYRSIAKCLLFSSSGNFVAELFQPPGGYNEVWILLKIDTARSPSTKGIPQLMATKPDKSAIIVHPIPSEVLTVQLLYYRVPDVGAFTTATTAATLEIEDTSALVRVIEAFARNWDGARGDLLGFSTQIAAAEFSQYKASSEDVNRANTQTVKLSKQWFGYRRGD